MEQTTAQARRRENALRSHFPEALIEGYEALVDAMPIHPKDRHVLAAAVPSGTKLIVTYNAKDFPDASLQTFGIERQRPSTFLINVYDLDPGIVVRKLSEQAQNLSLPLEALLSKLQGNVPNFVAFFCEERRIDLSVLSW